MAGFVALALLGTSATAQPASRMVFRLASDPIDRVSEVTLDGQLSIYASGPIEDGDAERLKAFVQERRLEAAKVVFDSPGGSLLEGMRLGTVIRNLGFNTAIGKDRTVGQKGIALCASACAYAFAGGNLRYMDDRQGRLGLHQFRSTTNRQSESSTQVVGGTLAAYLARMGVEAEAFAVASVTDADSITWLNTSQATLLGFVNNGILPTTAEVKIVDMRPYLRLNQKQPGIQLRALLICLDRQITVQAGLVTDPAQAASWADKDWLKQSYLEIERHAWGAVPGIQGVTVSDSTVWLDRELPNSTIDALVNSNELGIWLDGFGAVRYGGVMDLRPAKTAMRDYIRQCRGSSN